MKLGHCHLDPWSPLPKLCRRNSNIPKSAYESYRVDATVPKNTACAVYLDSVDVAILARPAPRCFHVWCRARIVFACVSPARQPVCGVPALASLPPDRLLACLLAWVWCNRVSFTSNSKRMPVRVLVFCHCTIRFVLCRLFLAS